ncbi:Cof-type HAD-IIB family hydrolase [Cytobacillus spongiae]|uniref:HAD family hydrolase n=1 Tax=Cytobacillus spongiae TaxID=2901381 RepID=UPI001F1D0EEF|nr:HAD family hydrolase [Cytobacillus spongiae]UII55830.1 Cof-type HAD-IIB family hydrolase [Cytobacillus spongiae]
MIKCIAIDMDGTLLNSNQEVTEENKQAIKKAQSQGVEVVIATGRSYHEASFVLNEAGLVCPIICVNGAEARSVEGDVLKANALSKQQAKETATVLKEKGVYFEVYTNQGKYTEDVEMGITIIVDIYKSANPEVEVKDIRKKAEELYYKGFVHKVDSYEALFEIEEQQIYKLLAFSFDKEKLDDARQVLKTMDGLAVSSSGYDNIELTSVYAQKGVALEAFINEKGITFAETMAIGDNYNDLSMFQKVGRAVAMGNASEDIKAQCHEVTLRNNDSGVGKAIMKALEE